MFAHETRLEVLGSFLQQKMEMNQTNQKDEKNQKAQIVQQAQIHPMETMVQKNPKKQKIEKIEKNPTDAKKETKKEKQNDQLSINVTVDCFNVNKKNNFYLPMSDAKVKELIKALAASSSHVHNKPYKTFIQRQTHSTCGSDSACSEDAHEVESNLRQSENKFLAPADYMDSQPNINHEMRSILVDWLIEVTREMNFDPQALFLAVNYLDRSLSRLVVSRQKVQLIAITCMMIANKYDEIMTPILDDFVYICDSKYTLDDFRQMEIVILTTLHFNLTVVTPLDFLHTFAHLAHCDDKTKYLSRFFLETVLQEAIYLRFPPSVWAAVTLFLAMLTINPPLIKSFNTTSLNDTNTTGLNTTTSLNSTTSLNTTTSPPAWTSELTEITQYKIDQLREPIISMHTFHVKACGSTCTLKSSREKYSLAKYGAVATIKPLANVWFI